MVYLMGWFFVAFLLALWSLAAWAVHGMAVWAVLNAGALSETASGVALPSLPEGLESWVPSGLLQAATEWLAGLVAWVDGLLQAAPALSGGLTVLAWGVWGLGTVLLLLTGAGLHALTARWRGRRHGQGPGAGPTMAAR